MRPRLRQPSILAARFALLSVFFLTTACQNDDAAESEAAGGSSQAKTESDTRQVSFASPADGAVVSSPVQVEMNATGVTIEPAGEVKENAGHFHILVDTPFVTQGAVIPADSSHLHYGTGATTAEVTLQPGTHTLRLQVANGAHVALDPAVYGHQISITVQ